MATFLKFLAKEKLGVFTRKGPVLCKYTRPDTLHSIWDSQSNWVSK